MVNVHYRLHTSGKFSIATGTYQVNIFIDSLDNYYSVIIEHALIYQFAGTNILETL